MCHQEETAHILQQSKIVGQRIETGKGFISGHYSLNGYILFQAAYLLIFRGLETQAPLTMGEDDDEHTGIHGKCTPVVYDKEHQEKPKYKRQEFMRYTTDVLGRLCHRRIL